MSLVEANIGGLGLNQWVRVKPASDPPEAQFSRDYGAVKTRFAPVQSGDHRKEHVAYGLANKNNKKRG